MADKYSNVHRTLSTSTEIGDFFRIRREELGLTQKEVAEKLGVSRKWYIEMEQGKPTVELYKVLDTFWTLGLELEAKVRE